MEQSEKMLIDCINKLTTQLASMEQKVDRFTGDLGMVQTKVDLEMTSINLVQQEQVQVTKLLKNNSQSVAASRGGGIMGGVT
jgi:hypothetical protein